MDISALFANLKPRLTIARSEVEVAPYMADTGGAVRSIPFVLRIFDITVLQEVLLRANENGLKLWPVSGGKNYGYGTALPAQDDSIIVDLSSLKKIHICAETGIATLEPGVTQHDLYTAIEKMGLDFMVPTTGAGHQGSIIGNALDGGYGLNLVSAHIEALTRVQGYWGSGAPFDHPYAEMNCSAMAETWRSGLGPSMLGLLHQSNFGLVTRASVQLVRRMKGARIVALEFANEEAFYESLPTIKRLLPELPGLPALLFSHQSRSVATSVDGLLDTLESNSAEGRAAELAKIASKNGFKSWIALGFLYGTPTSVLGAAIDLKRSLPKAKVRTLTAGVARKLASLGACLPRRMALRGKIDSLSYAADLLEGRPTSQFLKLAYALKPGWVMSPTSAPAKDGCGILWYAPLLPMRASAIQGFLGNTVTAILHRHGFDALLGVTARNGNVLTATIPILFDRQDPDAVARAQACYREMLKAGVAMGFPPYRLGSDQMDFLHGLPINAPGGTWATLKAALDPNAVLSPGRYVK